ncbi:MAG: hypothetical protein LAP13_18970 [Acidobacteriia bacterium]|nr:hypothetical protein [Terriglobia bacterium]
MLILLHKKNRTLGLAFLAALMISVTANVAASETQQQYVLRNRFGTSVEINAPAGYYIVKQTTSSVAGSMVLPGDQTWFGRGVVSVFASRRWFRSADVTLFHVRGNDLTDGRLHLTGVKNGEAQDAFGAFQFVELNWTVPGLEIPIVTGFQLYQDRPALVFVQRFPKGFKGYANGEWTVPSVAFPQFVAENWGIPQNLYSWTSGGMWDHRLGWGDAFTNQGSVDPLVTSAPDYTTLILSSFANYLIATQQSGLSPMADQISRGGISCGIEGLVPDLPSGFEHKHILVAGHGIHNTFTEWGKMLLEKAGKKPPSKYQDDTLSYLLFMDDAGAYYYEHDFKEPGYSTYADIILAIEKEAREHKLRIGAYHVLDDKQQRDYHEGLYEPRKDLFPDGLAKFHEQLGKPLMLYMMWIEAGGPYRQKYAYFATDPGPIPGEMGDVFYTPEYWKYTADKLASWGTILLQHDFLSDYEGNRAMLSGLDKMDVYFKNMAKALQAKGIDMQYCMALPRNIMESTENPIMVSLQATDDHHVPMAEPKPQPDNPDNHDPFWWKHVIFTSALYGALGIWPSRDNIQTIADPNAFEDTLVANLLGGSIELGHRLGECNFDLLRKTYREGDGLLLKAGRPIVPIDRCYQLGCSVGYTQSDLGGNSWYYVLSLPRAGYLPSFKPADLGVTRDSVIYDWDTGVAFLRQSSESTPLMQEPKHQYFVVAPMLESGVAVIGDTSKFVTMADKRISLVETGQHTARVGVMASAEYSPIISGYSGARLDGVETGGRQLQAVSSLDRLKAANSGWFWDYQTNLWHVKLDFSDSPAMVERVFQISTQ